MPESICIGDGTNLLPPAHPPRDVPAVALVALAALALPADAARRPPGPAQAAPKPRAVVHTAKVPFRWQKAKRARGYDVRVARDRLFTSGMQTVHLRGANARLLLAPGPLVLEGARDGQGQLALVEHPAARRPPQGRRVSAEPPHALRVTAVAESSVTVAFGAAKDDRGVDHYELLAGSGKVLARGAAHR